MDVTKLTVPQLKEELKKHNLKITGTKQELIARLLEFTKESAPVVVAPAPVLAPLTAPALAPVLSPSLPIPAQVQGPLKPHVPVTLAGPNVTIPPKPVLAPSGPATIASSSVSTASAGKYAGMTVNQLKEELKAKGLKVSGTKAELIDRLTGNEGMSVETRQPIVPIMPGVPAVTGGPAVIPAPASPAGPSSSSSSPAVSAAEYGKMTVAQLREELRDLELKVSGTKPELIQRLMDYQSGKIISTGRRSSPAGSPASFAALGFKFVPKGEGEEESSEDEDIPEVPEGESSEEDPASDKEEEEEPVSDDE